jgi:hypothetical protein
MSTLLRVMRVFSSALILAVMISAAAGSPKRVNAGCEAGVTWTTNSEVTNHENSDTVNGKTTSTQDISISSEQHSDDGRTITDNQTFHRNANGSSHGTEDIQMTDSTGNACDSEGGPSKASRHSEDDTDEKGNRKLHMEEITEKNGKCIKNVRDMEWDSKGKLIKDTGWIETEIPCARWSLQIYMEFDNSVGSEIRKAGPNTYLIPLAANGNTFTGKYTGVWTTMGAGKCNWSGDAPVSYDVTAKEEKFGDQDELAFSVTESYSYAGIVAICPGADNQPINVSGSGTNTFTLPAEDGASWTDPVPGGSTYTLKK